MLGISIEGWRKINRFLPSVVKMQNLGDKMHKAAGVLTSKTVDELYLGLVSHWTQPEKVVLGAKEPLTALTDLNRKPALDDQVEMMMALDSISYLPDDILVKVDRASMGVSLESRIPFLNHELLELAWKIPLKYKLRDGKSKWCLRQVLYKYVPKDLIERPKMGFGMPIGEWLRGPLRDWAEELLEEDRLRQEGFFDPYIIRTMWHEHLNQSRNWQYHLWDVLMFQLWYEKHHK
jgi:asparagine synthase (glutamine-hydrolysing)